MNELANNANEVRFAKFSTEAGMLPHNELPSKSRNVSSVNCPMDDGIVPVSALLSSFNFVSRTKFPIEDGMLPTSPVCHNVKYVSCVKSPISVGIVDPLTVSLLSLLKLSVDRQSDNDERPMKLQATCSGFKDDGVEVTTTATGAATVGDDVGSTDVAVGPIGIDEAGA